MLDGIRDGIRGCMETITIYALAAVLVLALLAALVGVCSLGL